MCNNPMNPLPDSHLNRRGFVTGAAAVASGLLASSWNISTARADALTKEVRDKMTPDEIIALMKKGNERFRNGECCMRNFLAEQKATAKGQYPAAVVLSCIDSRAPAEIVLDLGIGDVFNARVAGNIANEDLLGSMEFACKLAGAKVIVVMAHTACGAIRGAIDDVELGNLTGLVGKIRPAVKATKFEGERSSSNPKFVDAVARKNVALTKDHIREKSAVLRELEAQKRVMFVGAMYDLETAMVEFFT